MKEIIYIFLTFLKLGSVSFGGYMALVAMVQKQLVEIDRKLSEKDLLDGISLTSVLPGPVAVNMVTYAGYRMKGTAGAIAAFTGIIIPSFLLIILLSILYFRYEDFPFIRRLFAGITPAITALILTVAIHMSGKNLRNVKQGIICFISALLLILTGGYKVTCAILLVSGLIGYFLFKPSQSEDGAKSRKNRLYGKEILVALLLFCLLWGVLSWGISSAHMPLNLRILTVFSGISLTLFGGGYVVIPALHELFVTNLDWLTATEFADGIGLGQVTPGPIFITATFIGFKVNGFWGAVCATLGIFTPPAVVTVLLSRFYSKINNNEGVKAVMKGIHPAVIGMIFASVVTIGKTVDLSPGSFLIFALTIFLSLKYNLSPVWLISGAALLGLLFL